MPSKEDITRLLSDLNAGKTGAEEALFPLVYDELRALASHFMRDERPSHTLQTTALVHEAYLRLGGIKDETWENRAHYLRVAAQAMRRVLIDHARHKKSGKKGGGWQRESLDQAAFILGEPSIDLVALDQGLNQLSEMDPQLGQVVELRFFGGLTVEETARVLGISPRTVKSDWRMARAWLKTRV